MIHLHFRGWVDRTAASDEPLVNEGLAMIQQFSPDPLNPVAINCAAGRGRTLILAAAYKLRRDIYETWVHGGDIRKFVVNLPELMYYFHKFRDLDGRNAPEGLFLSTLTQVLSLTNAYAQSLLSGACPKS